MNGNNEIHGKEVRNLTVAELHGKISHTGSNVHERLEDLLTADVFGPLRYLPTGTAPLQLLTAALNVLGSPSSRLREHPVVSSLLVHARDKQPQVQFWPRLTRSEPDLMLTWPISEPGRLVLFLEVKYLSGKSGDGMEENDQGQIAVSDQLGRQYQDLCQCLGPDDRGLLVYLTAHPGLPRMELAASLTTITPDPRADVYWLSWHDVYHAVRAIRSSGLLEPWVTTLWRDIQQLLERKGLTGLRDWNEILGDNGSGHQVSWYQRRDRQMDYHWQQLRPSEVPRWYLAGTAIRYAWPTGIMRSSVKHFYHGG